MSDFSCTIWQFIPFGKSVTPQPNKEKWIEYCYQNFICSKCGYIAADTDIDEYKYCPNCGAKMEVENGK
jgi:rubrerythrin